MPKDKPKTSKYAKIKYHNISSDSCLNLKTNFNVIQYELRLDALVLMYKCINLRALFIITEQFQRVFQFVI